MEFVWSRTWGEATISVISEGHGWWPVDVALEGVAEEHWRPLIQVDQANRMPVGFNLVHASLPTASILFDAGWGPHGSDERVDAMAASLDMERSPGLEAGLSRLDATVEDITHVVISHMHTDHIAGATKFVEGRRAPAFPNARYCVLEREWQNAPADWNPLAGLITAQKNALLEAHAVDLVKGEEDIVSGVTLIPAPGESPGHSITRIVAGTNIVYYLGDLFHHPAELLHFDWMPRRRDRETLIATRRTWTPRFLAEGAYLIPAHFRFPAFGRLESVPGGYGWDAMPQG